MSDPVPATGPRRQVTLGERSVTLLGTAHVSLASAEEVRAAIRSGEFDAVAIELCPTRYQSLTDPDAMARMDLFQVLREGKAGMVAANLALGAYQQRLAEQSGIQPGEEMRAAIEESRNADLPVQLVDRDIGITLRRVYRSVPWWQRLTLISGLVASLISRQEVTREEIEELKEGDVLEATFAEFANRSRALYRVLIEERDRYMALRLMEADPSPGCTLVVIGAGHLAGMAQQLEAAPPADPTAEREALEAVPPRRRWTRALPWVVVAVILSGFAIGFSRSPELGRELVIDWFLINGVLAAGATALAWAHPLTVVGTFFAAPLTSLNPTIGAGFVAAGIELSLRRPTVAHFASLRNDVASLRGWWRNRVARTLLVVLMATLGSAAATYIAGFRIFGRLVGG